jgi:hypothetical protein
MIATNIERPDWSNSHHPTESDTEDRRASNALWMLMFCSQRILDTPFCSISTLFKTSGSGNGEARQSAGVSREGRWSSPSGVNASPPPHAEAGVAGGVGEVLDCLLQERASFLRRTTPWPPSSTRLTRRSTGSVGSVGTGADVNEVGDDRLPVDSPIQWRPDE